LQSKKNHARWDLNPQSPAP